MAIWAVAHIVRNMSQPDAKNSHNTAHKPEVSALSIDTAFPNRDATKNNSNQKVDRQDPARVNCMDQPQHEQKHIPETRAPANQDSDGSRKLLHTATNDHRATSSGSPCPAPEEVAFRFHEVDQRRSVSAVGNTPALETLEIELGTVRMSRDDVTRLGLGVVVALQESVDDEVLIRNSQRVVARGKMTIVDGKIAVRINETVG